MKFRIEHDVLATTIAWAARTVPTRPVNPVQAAILLVIGEDGDALRVVAGNDDTYVFATIEAEALSHGRVAVSGRLLADIVKALPAAPVEVSVENAKLHLACGASKFALPVMDAEHYPSAPAMPATAGTVEAGALASAIAQAAVAASREEMMPILCAAQLTYTGDTMELLSTDRFRLGLRSLTWTPKDAKASGTVLVPMKALVEATKAFSGTATVTVAYEPESGVLGLQGPVAGGMRRTVTRTMDGSYPNVRSLFPSTSTAAVRADRVELIEAVKRVSLVVERNQPIALVLADAGLRLEAGDNDNALASEQVNAEATGEDITAGFNPQFLIDGLAALNTEQVEISFTGALKPALITGLAAGADTAPVADPAFQYLVMPRKSLT